MKSVKGMTVCTPEFHKVAKAGEEQAEIKRLIERMENDIDQITIYNVSLSGNNYSDLASIRHDIDDILYVID